MQRPVAEHPLECEVVNCHHGGHRGVEGIVGIEPEQHVRDHRSVPVVHMDHVRLKAERLEHLQGGPAEVDETRIVVPEAVHALPAEELGIVDEVDGNVITDPPLQDVRRDRLGRERNREVAQDGSQPVAVGVDGAVSGHHHPDVVPQLTKGLR